MIWKKNLLVFLILCFCSVIYCLEASPYGDETLQPEYLARTSFNRFQYSGFEFYVGSGFLNSSYFENITVSGVNMTTFFPIVDQFSVFTVPGSGLFYRDLNDSIWITIKIDNIFSNFRYYRKQIAVGVVPDMFVGSWTAIVTLNNGVVQSIDWDDDCSQCASNLCINGHDCFLSYSNVGNCEGSNSYSCDIKIYVAWQGTDASGVPCTSLNYVPSRFELFALHPVWQAAAGIQTRLV